MKTSWRRADRAGIRCGADAGGFASDLAAAPSLSGKGVGVEGETQKIVIELKLLHKTLEQTLAVGLEQTWEYLDRCGAGEGHLVIFDRTPAKAWEEKLFQWQETVRDQRIIV